MSFRTNAGRGSNGHGVALFATTAGTGATQLVLTTAPGTGGASPYTVSPTPVVTAKSGAGVTDTSFVGVVTCTLNVLSGSPVLSGTTTKTAVAGVADFSANGLTVTGAGTWTLTFSSGSLSPAVSATGTTTSTAATKLTITTAPGLSGTTPYTLSPQPVVAAQNAGGSTDTSYVTNVVASLNVLTGSPVLSGTTTKTPVSGVATFTDLVVTGAGTWTITFTSGSLTSATSSTGTTTAGGTTFTNAIHFGSAAHQAAAAAHASYNSLGAFTVAILLRTSGASSGVVAEKGNGSSAGWMYRDNNPGAANADFTAFRATTADFKRDSTTTADNSWQWLFIAYDWSTNLVTRATGPMGGVITDVHRGATAGGAGANVLDGATAFTLGFDGSNSSPTVMEVRFVGIASSVLSNANMQAIANDAVAQAALFVDYWKPSTTGGSGTSIPSGKSVLPALVTSGATVV